MLNKIPNTLLIPIVLSVLCSCRPTITDQYTEDELVSILLDAHTLGLIYNRQDVRSDTLKMEYYDVLQKRYNLDREEFEDLVDGLIKNAEMYDRVYSRMTSKIEKMEHMEMEILTN